MTRATFLGAAIAALTAFPAFAQTQITPPPVCYHDTGVYSQGVSYSRYPGRPICVNGEWVPAHEARVMLAKKPKT